MKQEYQRLPELSPQLNKLLRQLAFVPELTKITTDLPTLDNMELGENRIYDDGTDK